MNYRLIPAERDDYCVCSVLQAILSMEGIDISQDDIAGRLTQAEDIGFLVDDIDIKALMREYGFRYSYFPHNETPFNEPDFLLEDMSANYGLIGVGHHARLLQDFKYPQLTMIDPKEGSLVTMDLKEVRGLMASKGGGFGLAKRL